MITTTPSGVTRLRERIAAIRVQSWDQTIGHDGADAILRDIPEIILAANALPGLVEALREARAALPFRLTANGWPLAQWALPRFGIASKRRGWFGPGALTP